MIPDSVIFMGLLLFFYLIYPLTQFIDFRGFWMKNYVRIVLTVELLVSAYFILKILELLHGV
jgi:hypothetical protein